MFLHERKRIALFAMAARLPTMFGLRENVEDGGLMGYGVDLRDGWRRTAAFVDKILKGTKPGDLPIVINLTAAKSARPRSAADAARPRRRGDRVSNCVVGSGGSWLPCSAIAE